MITVDALGEKCPIPVVKAKNAVKELGGAGEVEIFVDNEISVQNLTKMANQKNYGVKSEKLEEGKYRVLYTVSEDAASAPDMSDEEVANAFCDISSTGKGLVVAVGSAQMGAGDDELGDILMKAFIFSLTQQDEFPQMILFYNGGARLTCEGSPVLEDLKSLEAQGVDIQTCGTCLNHYGLAEKVQIGGVTNMYAIVEALEQATRVVKP